MQEGSSLLSMIIVGIGICLEIASSRSGVARWNKMSRKGKERLTPKKYMDPQIGKHKVPKFLGMQVTMD